jgi:dihydroorotase
MHDLVIKGGTLIDPSQKIHEKKDLAVSNGKIDDVRSRISDSSAERVIDASGMYVTPGLIDIHTHVANDLIRLSIDPDKHCLMNGTTTAVDAGSCGELNFVPFKKFVIERVRTRILAFLNVESLGMIEFTNSNPRNTDQEWPELLWSEDELYSARFVNLKNTESVIRRNQDTIVGLKWAHHGLSLLELSRKVADSASSKIMAESRYIPDSLKYLKRGDIATHIFHRARHKVTNRIDGISEDGKNIHSEVFAASKRGVVLDIGHGKGSFSWDVARLALREGLEPDTISTDLWTGNVRGPVHDLPTTMAKLLHLKMNLEKVIEATTTRPAAVLNRVSELGTLKPGSEADVLVFRLHPAKIVLTDSYGKSELAEKTIMPISVLRHGEIVRNAK